MKKIILLIIILIVLTGCSDIYNLSSFLLPDDIEFIKLVEVLNTPEKICQYMLDNFTYQPSPYASSTPYEMYTSKTGDCNDYSTFGTFIANYHGYETYQVIITFLGDQYTHALAVYKEDRYSFSDNGYYYTGKYNYNSFLEIVEYESYLREQQWLKYVVYDYDMNIVETNVQ